MPRLMKWSIATLALASLAFLTPIAAAHAKHGKFHPHPRPSAALVAFQSMYGVDGPFLGPDHAIDGIAGDDLPWEIEGFAHGRLDVRGRLVLIVRGLVFKDDPSVPPELRGKNDEAEFRAAVGCLTEIGEEDVEERVVVSNGFAADEDGNSIIVTTLELPDPCVAPHVFVLAGAEDKWFAVTGFESEEDEGEE